MKLISFDVGNGWEVGMLLEAQDAVFSISAAGIAKEMAEFVSMGDAGIELAYDRLDRSDSQYMHDLGAVKIGPPLPHSEKSIICVGKNYALHAREFQSSGFDGSGDSLQVPALPVIFSKASSSVVGSGHGIPAYLDPTCSVDYEGELGIVISKAGRKISKKDAFEYVYGYTIVNDVTSRQIQKAHKQWFLGKSLDGFCPMGPYLVTADEIADVSRLRLRTWVNGDLRQDATVADLIFDIPTLVETISLGMTLSPGDVIATGTPEGVGIGFDPPRFLQKGDVVTISIDGLGELSNPVA